MPFIMINGSRTRELTDDELESVFGLVARRDHHGVRLTNLFSRHNVHVEGFGEGDDVFIHGHRVPEHWRTRLMAGDEIRSHHDARLPISVTRVVNPGELIHCGEVLLRFLDHEVKVH